jgi:hypothetical protein
MKKQKYYWFESPFWAILAYFGYRLTIRVEVLHDEEVGVYVATSKNMRGLVCEADTLEELKAEVDRVVRDIAAFCARGRHPALPVVEWPAK